MRSKYQIFILFAFATVFLLSENIFGQSNCDFSCQLELNGYDNSSKYTVQEFIDTLIQINWIQVDYNNIFYEGYSYRRDSFSNILETTLTINLNGENRPNYISNIKLYIEYVGGNTPEYTNIPLSYIQAVQLTTNIPIIISFILYGIPDGGVVLPFYLASDNETMCEDWSHYIAYYIDEKMIIRSTVGLPLLTNFWITPVEILYPVSIDDYDFSWWLGRFERMHSPCIDLY